MVPTLNRYFFDFYSRPYSLLFFYPSPFAFLRRAHECETELVGCVRVIYVK